ncbi:MAG: enoyl-CoA hydratase-related protein [Bacteroidia bacterium]|nr:enoyl-CoA hydratase-related protein [Bacteroidia bacterium]MCX7763890.1 enoyl-CoA hydratase-related protein [Bacteroidia bacterium]MDW8056787.1 enoyl-CoA hydratase-related protein [Bacteroidia bacterium]
MEDQAKAPLLIKTEVRDRIGYLTLNRPERRNALSYALVSQIKQALTEWQEKDEVRLVVLRAEGPVFCSGADIEYLQKLQNYSFQENLADSMHLMELYLLMYRYKKPLIAQVEGPALAGGAGLVTVCDLVVATPEATIGYPEARIGFLPAMVTYFLIRRVGEGWARQLLITAEPFSAEKAHAAGLFNYIVPKEEIKTFVHELATKIVRQNSPTSLEFIRKLIADMQDMPLQLGLEFAAKMNAHARATEDFRRGIAAFLRKEKIEW